MILETLIAALRTRCPAFAGRVAGAARYQPLPASSGLPVPSAWVIPLDDNPGENKSHSVTRQPLNESFGVIVALSNTTNERGQAAALGVHQIRAQLWAALLGWSPDEEVYDGIVYEGGALLSMDSARLWYQFEFSAAMEIGPADGYQAGEHAALPHFDGVDIDFNALDPADPNRSSGGPDDRIEVQFSAPADGPLP